MPHRSVYYDLDHGFIHNWLIAGSQSRPIDLDQFPGDNLKQEIAKRHYEPKSGITETPVERGPLTAGLFQVDDYAGSWEYYACREDHLVEKSGVYLTPHYLRSWAYTQLDSKSPQEVSLVLFAHGPADIWLNDQHVQRQEQFYAQHPGSVTVQVSLKKGVNRILVRFEAVAIRECPYAIALQVCKVSDGPTTKVQPFQTRDGIRVSIPTLIDAIARRGKFERAAAQTYVAQDVFESSDQIRLHWPDDLEKPASAVIRLMRPNGQIYAEATVNGTAGDQVFLQRPLEIPEGPYRILMMPLAWEYYERNLRITREISLWNAGRSPHAPQPYGTYEERRKEALVSAARREGLFAEIAKMALNNWTAVESEAILQSIQSGRPQELLGILGMLYRFGEHMQFPTQLRQPLEDYILGYPFDRAEALETETSDREDEQILACAAEILAGQYYAEGVFSRSGKTGQWHRQNGERLALEWLHQRGALGFSDWDSNYTFAGCLLALSHLVDLAETESVWEMAAVLMDKIFVTMALNSFRGVFGSTHGRTLAPFVKGGLLEPTSGIARLMWGTGVFNHHIAGIVSLACMERYELPSMVSDIAGSLPEEIWSRERHAAVGAAREVNKVTYKTPDGMLCSAQDYYPGQQGRQEHIWQATLGTTATVFVTHPACTSEDEARQPNFWAGNAVLPRVAQWKDVLIAVYQLPEDDWMGFTHAYFPTYAFDEYLLRQGWVFARKGNGYLALMAKGGINLTKHGHYALRELRSDGLHNIWLCHLGRAALDGDFSSFQEKILALHVKFADAQIRFNTLRGEVLSFGWQGPFLRDDIEQPLSVFRHYENPFAASEFPSRQMEVRYGDGLLRLNFESVPNSQPE
ncbi:MAG TPA: hypothetical protein VFR47_31310 [Anaerolineales bacterium]|nr:hypothetical protein [Anaerolineales bacterium]